MRYSLLPRRLQWLIVLQSLVAAAIAYASWEPLEAGDATILGFLVLCGILGGACKVEVNVYAGRLSLGFTVTYFSLILLGTEEALLVGFLSTLAGVIFHPGDAKRRVTPRKALSVLAIYNFGNGVIATGAMGWVYSALGGVPGRFEPSAMALPILASALTYYILNTGGVTLAIAWSQSKSPVAVFREHWAWAWPGFLAGACVSAGLLWAYRSLEGGPAALLLLPPAYLVFYFYRMRTEKVRGDMDHMRELNRLNDAVIGSLAMAIEAKDRYTSKHVSRVREYATRLGEKLGVSEGELQAVRIASLLHDIGKIGIPEAILCKPGKLTSEEFEIIKSHVDIGAAILERINFPWPVAPVVRTHHERWDGLGYPQGLKGEEIPIGGRIISLVDVYDALTSDRPYRKAVTREQAIQILRAGSGSQFDPRVVETFVALLPELDAAITRIQEAVDAEEEAFGRSIPEPTPPPPPPCDETEEAAVLEALHDLVGSESGIVVMAPQLLEKVAHLVPYTTAAVYLKAGDQRTLVPIYAAGLWTELLNGIEIRVGEGVSGYVAATGEALVNAASALDLARRLRPSENLELNSTLSVPLLLQDEVVGAITLYHSSYNFYQPYHCARLERVARYAVEAVAFSRRDHLEVPLPSEDPVTRLPNQYSLQQFLVGQIHVSQTIEAEFAVVRITVEATSGVANGSGARERDQVMCEVARILCDTVRDGDYVARASANGFAVVLPGCGETEGRQTAQRVLEQASRDGLSTSGRVALQVGLAVYPRDGSTPEVLLAAAGVGASATGARRPPRRSAVA